MDRLLRIEIGCGSVNDRELDVRIDARELPHVDLVLDARDLAPVRSGSVMFLKNAALIEHLQPDEQELALREWNRVLCRGGVIFTQTPDLEWIEASEKDGTITKEWAQTLRTGGGTNPFDYHLGLLTAESARRLFEAHGFRVLELKTGTEMAGSLQIFAEKVREDYVQDTALVPALPRFNRALFQVRA